jgi:hypothetical protein
MLLPSVVFIMSCHAQCGFCGAFFSDMPEAPDREGDAASIQQLSIWLGQVQLIEDTLDLFS